MVISCNEAKWTRFFVAIAISLQSHLSSWHVCFRQKVENWSHYARLGTLKFVQEFTTHSWCGLLSVNSEPLAYCGWKSRVLLGLSFSQTRNSSLRPSPASPRIGAHQLMTEADPGLQILGGAGTNQTTCLSPSPKKTNY